MSEWKAIKGKCQGIEDGVTRDGWLEQKCCWQSFHCWLEIVIPKFDDSSKN